MNPIRLKFVIYGSLCNLTWLFIFRWVANVGVAKIGVALLKVLVTLFKVMVIEFRVSDWAEFRVRDLVGVAKF